MKYIFLFVILISVPLLGIPADKSTELFLELDDVIANKEKYENIKLEEIRQLKDRLNSLELNDHLQYFSICDQLHQSYFTFNYDSAMSYALRMIETARQLGMEAKISQAKISLTSTLLASGIFNEAKDTLASFGTTGFNDSLKIEYHYLYSRLYFDMADYYQKSNYIEKYIDLGLHYLDSAIALTDVYTQKYYSLMGLKYVRKHDYTNALSIYEILFGNYNPINRQLAIDASTYGYVLEMNDRLDEGINWLIIAAIEDVKLANKENVALINLANKLFQLGEIEKSSDYLNAALDDAKLYGALQRKFQISQIQPFVEAAKLNITEEQKARIKRYAFIVSLLSLLIVLILLILYRQFQKVKAAKDEINKSNDALKTTNQKLREVNLIKEEYIGHFFKTNSDLIDKLDAYRQKIENKIANHRIDDLQALVNKKSIKEEREEMYRTFDSVFLTIFPDFVPKFNALFQTKNQIILKNTEQLNTDLRIFALIRLGISDTEKIAHVLDYSVNTINTYKTKIKNRSTVSNEAFEQEILNIQSI